MPGGPNSTTADAGDHAVPLRLLALGQRQDHAALDQLLLTLHAADRVPQLCRQPLAAQLVDVVVRGGRVEAALLEVEDAVVLDVACGARRLGRSAGGGHDHRDVADAEREQPPLERAKQLCIEAETAPFGSHRPAQDPGARAVHACGDRAGDLVAGERDERGLPRGDRGEHVGERERLRFAGRLVPRGAPPARDAIRRGLG